MLVVGLEDFSIKIVDIDTHRIIRKFTGHTAQLTDATFSPDSRWLITSAMDCSLRIWDVPTGQLVDQFATEAACVSVDMSPKGDLLATAHIDRLGIFLWSNRTLYSKVTLKAISPETNPPLITLPDTQYDVIEDDSTYDSEKDEFLSSDQISKELVTLSGLSTSRWQNLLNLDIIKTRNKPKAPPKTPKAAPFFLPTISSLNNIQFDIGSEVNESSKLLQPVNLSDLTEFGKLLDKTKDSSNFVEVIEYLKSLGPSRIDFEIKSLAQEGMGNRIDVILQFLKCIEFMLKSNKDFELAVSYLSVFLKAHTRLIAGEESLCCYLPIIKSCHSLAWDRLQEKLMYSTCIVQNLKNM